MENVIYVHRNDYQAKMKENASKLYNESGYSMKDYERDSAAMQIIPLIFTDYPRIQPVTQKLINAVFLEEDTDRNGKYMLRGSYMSGMEYVETYIDALKAWSENRGDSISGFGGNKDELFVLTWTEGDLTLTPCKTEEEYRTEMDAMIKWWEEER